MCRGELSFDVVMVISVLAVVVFDCTPESNDLDYKIKINEHKNVNDGIKKLIVSFLRFSGKYFV